MNKFWKVLVIYVDILISIAIIIVGTLYGLPSGFDLILVILGLVLLNIFMIVVGFVGSEQDKGK